MAKKLAKAQFGKIIKAAVKTVAKIKSPTQGRTVNSLLKGKESMVNANNPSKLLKNPRSMTKAEIQQKQIDDSYKQTGGASPYSKLVGDSTMTSQSKKAHPEKWTPNFKSDKSDSTRKAKSNKAIIDYNTYEFNRAVKKSPISTAGKQVAKKGGQIKSKK